MKKWLLIFILTFSAPVFSQIQGESEVSLQGDLIYPEFEGGLDGFYKQFYKMLSGKKVKKGEIVVASVVIDKAGLMTKIKIIKFKDDDTAMSVLQTLKEMNELEKKWQPATRLGEVVPVKLEFPFKFIPKKEIE